MQISRATEYALLGLGYLAKKNGSAASAAEIGENEKLSVYFLRNVFQKLRDAKLITTKTGEGYLLAKKPNQISLKDIVEAVEGPVNIHACLQKKNTKCMRSGGCKILKTWSSIQEKFIAELQKIRLTDLI
jgi:Rrf2 family protein